MPGQMPRKAVSMPSWPHTVDAVSSVAAHQQRPSVVHPPPGLGRDPPPTVMLLDCDTDTSSDGSGVNLNHPRDVVGHGPRGGRGGAMQPGSGGGPPNNRGSDSDERTPIPGRD